MEIGKRQSTRNLLMIRPAFFRFNAQTDDNVFSRPLENLPLDQLVGKRSEDYEREVAQLANALNGLEANVFDLSSRRVLEELKYLYMTQDIHEQALREFDQVVAQLRRLGVNVVVIEDDPKVAPPDSIFSNNWITTHQDGAVIVYPMRAESRRKEVRMDVIGMLQNIHGFEVRQILDWTHKADERHFLEGTGSMVFDRANNTAYAALSDRTHSELLVFMMGELNCRLIAFETLDTANLEGIPFPVYHTDVMMCIGEHFALLCSEIIRNERQREKVISELKMTGHELIEIDREQLMAFAGNVLEVENDKGEKIVCISQRAYDSLRIKQVRTLEKHARLEVFNIPVIETVGGGGVRCMLTEIFLPQKPEHDPLSEVEAALT